jgi:hypothetical protein
MSALAAAALLINAGMALNYSDFSNIVVNGRKNVTTLRKT